MYTDYYGFTENPFNITPDPRFLYLTEAHLEALASLLYVVKERKGFICITGEVGTGKTTLIYHTIDRLPDGVQTAFVYNTSTTFDQLLKSILLELRVPVGSEETYLLVHRLNAYLIERLTRGETAVVFIDEAQNLPTEALESLRLLSNLETRSAKLLQIVLVGQPELDAKLDSTELRQLRQRIVLRQRIRPLTEDESRAYIDHRLRIVGATSAKVFTPEAVALLCSRAGGIPRLINVICDTALIIGYGAHQRKIGEDIIREVLRKMEVTAPVTAPLAQTVPQVPENDNNPKAALLKKLLSAVTAKRAERPLRQPEVPWARS